MPSVFTIEGTRGRGLDAAGCKRVRMGKKRCTILSCRGRDGRMRFKKGTMRCG